MLLFAACSESNPVPMEDDPDPTPDPVPSKWELITTLWDIDTATHDGNHDASSTGKYIEFYENGGYNFNGDLQGSWHFNLDSSKVIIDEGSNYQQDWTITELSDARFEADFRSPFTNKPSKWIMKPR